MARPSCCDEAAGLDKIENAGETQVLGSGEMRPRAFDDACAEGFAVARPSPHVGGPLQSADPEVTRFQEVKGVGATNEKQVSSPAPTRLDPSFRLCSFAARARTSRPRKRPVRCEGRSNLLVIPGRTRQGRRSSC